MIQGCRLKCFEQLVGSPKDNVEHSNVFLHLSVRHSLTFGYRLWTSFNLDPKLNNYYNYNFHTVIAKYYSANVVFIRHVLGLKLLAILWLIVAK